MDEEQNIKSQLRLLRSYRDKEAELGEKLRAEKAVLISTYENAHKAEIKELTEITIQKQEVENALRTSALELYEVTHEKQLYGGIGIAIRKVLEYEETTAMEWAKKTGLALTLDKKAFEKIAKADKPEFVEIKEIPSVRIPTDIKIENE